MPFSDSGAVGRKRRGREKEEAKMKRRRGRRKEEEGERTRGEQGTCENIYKKTHSDILLLFHNHYFTSTGSESLLVVKIKFFLFFEKASRAFFFLLREKGARPCHISPPPSGGKNRELEYIDRRRSINQRIFFFSKAKQLCNGKKTLSNLKDEWF